MEKEDLKLYLDHDTINRIAQFQKMIKYYNQKIQTELDTAFKKNGINIPNRRDKDRRNGV